MNPQLVNSGVREMGYRSPYSYKGLASPVDERGLSVPMMYGVNETLQLKLTQYPGPTPGYTHLILAANGFLYSFPFNGTGQMLKVNPSNGSFTQFGAMGASDSFRGGVRGPNGKLYGVPSGATFVAVVDTNTDTITQIGTLPVDFEKYCGGVLAPNGKIYCPPNRGGDILVIDTNTDTVSTIGSFTPSSVGFKFTGVSLAPNGKIYCVPGRDVNGTSGIGERRVLVIDPSSDTYYFTANIYDLNPPNMASTGTSFVGAILAMNNKIYSIGWLQQCVLEINPENDSLRFIPLKGFVGNRPMYTSTNGNFFPVSSTGQLATSGKIYSQIGSWPSVNTRLNELTPYEFDTQTETLNKIFGCDIPALSNITVSTVFTASVPSIDKEGNLWFVGWGADYILKLSGFLPATPDMYTLPPLAQLSTSLYNKFINKGNGIS